MTIVIEFGAYVVPHFEETLFGWIMHMGWVSVGVFNGRLSDKLFAWRSKLEQVVQP